MAKSRTAGKKADVKWRLPERTLNDGMALSPCEALSRPLSLPDLSLEALTSIKVIDLCDKAPKSTRMLRFHIKCTSAVEVKRVLKVSALGTVPSAKTCYRKLLIY